MTDELKKGMKLIKYGFNLKSSILVGILVFISGIVFIVVDHETFLIGGTFIMLGPMMLIQIVFTLLCANSVAASPKKRVLEMWIPNLVEFVIAVFTYIVVIAITLLKIYETHKTPELENGYLKNLVCMGIMGCILIIYMSIAYKYFFMSILFGCFAYVYFVISDILLPLIKFRLTIVTASLIGFCFIILGSVMSLMLSKAFYKKPVSKYAIGGALRKYM
ncbi:MAG: hypothetical protein K2I10_05760 [Lachnospiraceae bacterium]|nr:hypothetical protein [Lachnospiraceae bacterium]